MNINDLYRKIASKGYYIEGTKIFRQGERDNGWNQRGRFLIDGDTVVLDDGNGTEYNIDLKESSAKSMFEKFLNNLS